MVIFEQSLEKPLVGFDPVRVIRFEIEEHASLTDMCEVFDRFLKALGYHEGAVDIVTAEDNNPEDLVERLKSYE